MGTLFDTDFNEKPKKKMGRKFLAIAGLAFLGALIFLITQLNIIGSKPAIELVFQTAQENQDPEAPLAFGKNPAFSVRVTIPKNDLCTLNAFLIQNGQKTDVINKKQGNLRLFSNPQPFIGEFVLASDTLGPTLQEGQAELTVMAKDCSLWHRTTQITRLMTIDLTPPRLELTSTQHYINQGGADVVAYKVEGDVAWSGVKIGPHVFTGHLKPGSDKESGDYFSFFVFSYDLPIDTKIEVIARDLAGNETKADLVPAKFFPKEFKHRELVIDDAFIQTKVAAIIVHTPELKDTGDNLKNYLMVNSDLRKINNQFLINLSKKSEEKFYWQDAFKPLTHAAIESNFADFRSYIYQGQKVDEQVHLGFDMAVTKNYPIYASGAGRVVFAGYFGIYGNTVIIDHGYGLMSLYGHLNSIDVKEDQIVKREEIIGNSGETGLAGGDHLHFSMLIDGVQTNPIEFWDPHWIDDHVYLRVAKNLFGQE